ncbi:MAG: flagellar hook-basal body protein, partial [Desulfovermiculus sp.]
MEVLSNNLANVSTPGFKQERSYFQSILDNRVQAGAGSGVNYSGMNGTETDFSQGRIKHTGRDLDLAIQGDGFFKVADENGFYYTRHGGFMRMPDGAVVNRSGQQLVGENGPIQIPDNGVHIDQDGVILGADGQQLGRIDVYTVPDMQNLQKQGNSLWGFDQAGAEEVADESSIHQSHLESSNVSPIWITTNLIESNRSFQSYQRAVKAYDTVAEKTNSIGRIG